MTTTGTPTEPRYAWGRRGRHRRPRPRRVLLAAGGLALAAGALSVVRLLPESGGDPGAFGAGAGPRVEGSGRGAAQDRATSPGATGGGPSGASPSPTSVMGGLSGSPAPGLLPGLVPAPSASGPAAPLPATTTGPDGPDGPDTPEGRGPDQGERTAREGEEGTAEDDPGDRAPAPGTPQPSRSDRPAPPPPPEGGTPPTSDPEPEPDSPGLCVPVIGLCVDLLRG
ncbi:hypothetical protein ACFU78_32815 [Streptomyces tendae]|uniref:hypothetical protein n=1 Tax=Streptomyces tendae TaxID=1932 RepID=UPI0036C2239D